MPSAITYHSIARFTAYRVANAYLLNSVLMALQSSMKGLTHQVSEAAASDKFEEANALQAELDSSTEEANALAAEHSFTPDDMQDLAVAPTHPAEQSLPEQPESASSLGAKVEAQANGNKPHVAMADDPSGGRKTQDSQDLSNALSREGVTDYEDEESVDVDAGYSSSVVSASHAATDGSRSVQSARTVLDRMPEFNMDDAVSFRCLLEQTLHPACTLHDKPPEGITYDSKQWVAYMSLLQPHAAWGKTLLQAKLSCLQCSCFFLGRLKHIAF